MSQLLLAPFTVLTLYAASHHQGDGRTGWFIVATVLALQILSFLLGLAAILTSLYRRLRRH